MVERDVDIDLLFAPGNEKALVAYLRLLHPADIATLFNYVAEEHWKPLAQKLKPEILAEVLADLDESQRSAIGELLQTDRLIRVVEELETDDAADVLADFPQAKTEAVLDALEDGAEIRVLLAYPEDSAGGIMQSEVCRVHAGARVQDAVEAVRRARDIIDDVLEVFVVDHEGRLTGVLDLEDLLVSDPAASIDTVSHDVEYQVTPEVDQEEVAIAFGKYDLVTLPVVDEHGLLLGRITFDDVHDVMEEEASEDIMAMAGASPEELVYGRDFVRIAMHRLPWLTSSLIGSLITGFLISRFEFIVGAQALIMASFVPVVMAMTGNVGTQSAMIITRGLAIGKIELDNLSRTFFREIAVGAIMGLSAGGIVGLTARLWKGDPTLGLALATCMFCSMSAAALVGVLAPVIFKRLGADPAIAAGPLVTTGCDMMAVSVYVAVAALYFGTYP